MTNTSGWKLVVRALSGTGRWRLPAALAFDTAVVAWCWHAAYLFRMGWERWQPARPEYDDAVLATVLVAELACLWALGFYRMPWRFFGFRELTRLTGTFAVVGAISRMALRLLWEESQRRAAVDAGTRQAVVLCSDVGPGFLQALKPIQASPQWALLGAFAATAAPRGAGGLAAPGVRLLGDLAALPGHAVWQKAHYVLLVRSGGPLDAALSDVAYKTGKPVIPVDAGSVVSGPQPAMLPH
jgi:hypothetical protein